MKPSFPSLRVLKFEKMDNWEKWLCCGCRRGEFPRLRELNMRYCHKFKGKLPKQLRSLQKLEIVGCPQLLVPSLRAPAINELKMVGCGKLQLKWPTVGFTAFQNSHIQISSISQWKQLPEGMHLQHLSIKECDSVETLLEEELLQSNTITCLLQSLEIIYCGFSTSLHRVSLATTNALKRLSIYRCSKIELLLPVLLRCHHPFLQYISLCDSTWDSLPLSFSLSIFPRLCQFVIRNLEGLEFFSISISEDEDPISSLGYELSIERCSDLVYIGLPAVESARYLISRCRKLKLLALAHTLPLSTLESLSLFDCPELLLHRDGFPSSLSELHISSCNQLTSAQLDWGLQTLASLTTLTISDECQDVPSFPREFLLPSTITTLEIQHLPNLKSLDSRGLQHLTSLTTLSITSCPELESFTEAVEHLPNLKSLDSRGLQHLTSLTTLSISNCPKLESLTEAGLQHLISLETLHISDCLKLQYLTEERLPNYLSFLVIKECPLLEDRCQFEKGQDWQYIAHIPHIVINHLLY